MKISLFYKIKMSGESSKNSKTIQSTLNFPLLYTISKDKGKSKEINNLELKKQVNQKTLSNFVPSIVNKNLFKRNIKEVIGDDSNSNSNTDSDDNDTSSSDSEYEMEIDVNLPPNICDKEKKLRRNKYFLELITPKLIRCQCGKQIKLDRSYRDKNLITHARSNGCQIRSDRQVSVIKYFSKTLNQQSAATEQNSKACIGLTNEKIENYVIKSPAEFGGSKNDYVIAKRLFPKKFPENSKFSYSHLTSEESQQLKTTLRAYAKWIIEKETLSVRSIKCELFTLNTNKICNKCIKLKSNKNLLNALETVCIDFLLFFKSKLFIYIYTFIHRNVQQLKLQNIFQNIGKDTIRYDQILTLAKDNNSALYMRDVINVDKQDDSAAFRFFSSALLKQCQKNGIVDS